MRLWPLFSTLTLGVGLASPARADHPGGCLDSSIREGGLYRIVRHMKIGGTGPSVDIGIQGLRAVDDTALWELVAGAPPTRLTLEQAAVFLDRLEQTRLFAKIDLTVGVREDGTTLDVTVVEHPVLENAVIRGIDDRLHGDDLLGALLEHPLAADTDEEECPAPVPPQRWLARLDGEEVRPGIVWDGVAGGLERVTRKLYDDGYQMASVSGRLDAQGVLTLDVDEGRIEAVEIVGVHPRLVASVRRELRLEPGRVFLMADATAAVQGLKVRFPFLVPTSARRPTRSLPGLRLEAEEGAGLRLVTVESPVRKEETYLQVVDHRVIVHLEPRRSQFTLFDGGDGTELLHHTTVTGYTPGITARRRVWDPADRVHLTLAADVNGSFRDDHVEWLTGMHLTLPGPSIAELGFQFHDFSDTSDRWRIDRFNSYLDSLAGSGRRTDYFRRKGFAAFVTGHFAERLTAGVEYRIDRYGSQAADLESGEVGSLVFRGEWSTARRSTKELTGLWRHPETSLFQKEERSTLITGFRTLATVEVARASLGSSRDFTRTVSDSVLTLAFGRVHGLRLRGRVGGGSALPAIREETLGGWSALRGYRMKEFRGDWSVLGMIEYRIDWLSGFLDVGSVRQPTGWIEPRIGVGGKLHLTEEIFVTAAWRTDALSKSSPEIRLFFQREF